MSIHRKGGAYFRCFLRSLRIFFFHFSIDFIVDFLPVNAKEYADNYYDLKFSLEQLLNRKVDLLEETAIKNPYFLQSIQDKKQMLYGN